jgi:hypothetical protein
MKADAIAHQLSHSMQDKEHLLAVSQAECVELRRIVKEQAARLTAGDMKLADAESALVATRRQVQEQNIQIDDMRSQLHIMRERAMEAEHRIRLACETLGERKSSNALRLTTELAADEAAARAHLQLLQLEQTK